MKNLRCPNCSASLGYSENEKNYKCKYCDSIFDFELGKNAYEEINRSSIGNLLLIAETALDGGSYEEALNYYNKVLESDPKIIDAWINKGVCILRVSKIGDLKISESISAWKTAIRLSTDTKNVKKRVATEINNAVVDFYPVLEKHYWEFRSVKNSIVEHGKRFLLLESALSFAMEISPSAKIAKNGIALCDRFVNSVKPESNNEKQDIFEWMSQDALAKSISEKLIETKNKYNAAAAMVDPAFAEKLKKDKIKEKEQADAFDKSANRTCFIGSLVLAIIFSIGAYIRTMKATGNMATTVDPSEHNLAAVSFCTITFLLFSSAVYFLRRLMKKN